MNIIGKGEQYIESFIFNTPVVQILSDSQSDRDIETQKLFYLGKQM